MVRIRTIQEAVKEIKTADKNTAITEYYVRQLVNTKTIPAKKSGKKWLINMDWLEAYLEDNRGTD